MYSYLGTTLLTCSETVLVTYIDIYLINFWNLFFVSSMVSVTDSHRRDPGSSPSTGNIIFQIQIINTTKISYIHVIQMKLYPMFGVFDSFKLNKCRICMELARRGFARNKYSILYLSVAFDLAKKSRFFPQIFQNGYIHGNVRNG